MKSADQPRAICFYFSFLRQITVRYISNQTIIRCENIILHTRFDSRLFLAWIGRVLMWLTACQLSSLSALLETVLVMLASTTHASKFTTTKTGTAIWPQEWGAPFTVHCLLQATAEAQLILSSTTRHTAITRLSGEGGPEATKINTITLTVRMSVHTATSATDLDQGATLAITPPTHPHQPMIQS